MAAGLRLGLWFAAKSVHGGADVAVRAARLRTDVTPQVVTAPLEVPPGGARRPALLMVNLMPGTMVQQVREARPCGQHHVELHTLSPAPRPAEQRRRLQELVAPVFDEEPGCDEGQSRG